ncbi:hypothetical protein GcM1_059004, partial [Golovinomyces cichoracearum]
MIEEVISTEMTPLTPEDAAQCVDLSANFDIAASVDEENLGENTADNETVLDIATKQGRAEIAECRQSVLEEEISTEKTPSDHDDSTHCADSSVHSENIEFIEHENPDENAANDEIVQDITTEPTLGETAVFKHHAIEEEISTETTPLSHDDVTQCADSSVFHEIINLHEKENTDENDAGDEIVQDITTEPTLGETAEFKHNAIEEEILTETI